jgi:hypothetical protein
VGLATKNAILIVEFAREGDHGRTGRCRDCCRQGTLASDPDDLAPSVLGTLRWPWPAGRPARTSPSVRRSWAAWWAPSWWCSRSFFVVVMKAFKIRAGSLLAPTSPALTIRTARPRQP